MFAELKQLYQPSDIRYRVPMGKKTVHFKCQHCRHCCTDVVCLPTPWDIVRIIRETYSDPHDFVEFLLPEEISGVEDDPTWLTCNGTKFIMALKRGEGGCYFLSASNGHCEVYESRPILCRLFPFKLQETRDEVFKGFTLHNDVECPKDRNAIFNCEHLHQLYLADFDHQETYDELVDLFNEKPDPKRPEEFFDLFI